LTKDVYRTEIRFKSKALKLIEGFEMDRIHQIEYQKTLLRTGITNFVKFHKKPNHTCDSNFRRFPVVELFNWNKIGGDLLDRSESKPVDDIYKVKLMIHKLSKDQIIFGYDDKLSSLVQRYVGSYDLEDWYTNKLEAWEHKYTKARINIQIKEMLNSVKVDTGSLSKELSKIENKNTTYENNQNI
jgi:hypothetical protein